jgi:hypothetical protein
VCWFDTAKRHGLRNHNSKIPAVYIQLGVCGELIIAKVIFLYWYSYELKEGDCGQHVCVCVKVVRKRSLILMFLA